MFLSMSALAATPMAPVLAKDGRGDGDGGRGGGRGEGDRGHGRGEGGGEPGRGLGKGRDAPSGERRGESARSFDKESLIGPDAALSARSRGEIISLKEALDVARQKNPGKVIDVKLFSSGDTATYRIKTMDRNGAVKSTRLDAHTGEERGLLEVFKRSLGLDEDTSGGR